MLRLNCFFSAHEGKYEEALDAALALTACSRKDEGTVAYDTFESATNPDVFMICETWENEEVLKNTWRPSISSSMWVNSSNSAR